MGRVKYTVMVTVNDAGDFMSDLGTDEGMPAGGKRRENQCDLMRRWRKKQ